MGKTPEIRIKVHDLDRLMKLTWGQERVWMYYKRREGADGKAFGKAQTIADWTGVTPGAVRNLRAWLVKNGWLRPNGRSKSGLPMFLAVIPRLHPETDQVSSCNDTAVIVGLHPVSLQDDTEVPTQKEQPEKDSVSIETGVSESVVSELSKTDDKQTLTPEATTVLSHIYPRAVPSGLEPSMISRLETFLANNPVDWKDYFEWHRTHKSEALRWRALDTFLAGIEYSLNDLWGHDANTCKVCNPKGKKFEVPEYTAPAEPTIFGAPIPEGMCPKHREAVIAATQCDHLTAGARVRDVMTQYHECPNCVTAGDMEKIMAQNQAKAAAASFDPEEA